jgi:hypothetical protein
MSSTYRYAQIDEETRICVADSWLHSLMDHPLLVPIFDYPAEETPLGLKWTGEAWVEPEA